MLSFFLSNIFKFKNGLKKETKSSNIQRQNEIVAICRSLRTHAQKKKERKRSHLYLIDTNLAQIASFFSELYIGSKKGREDWKL